MPPEIRTSEKYPPMPETLRQKLEPMRGGLLARSASLYRVTLLRPLEIEVAYLHAQEIFDAAQQNPYGRGIVRPLIRRASGHLDPEVKRKLHKEGIEVVLPLELQEAVRTGESPVTYAQLEDLQGRIEVFTRKFRNTERNSRQINRSTRSV